MQEMSANNKDLLNDLLTCRETATLLRTTPPCLATSRCLKRSTPPFIKVGRRILYRRSAVEKWLEEHTVTPSSREHAVSPAESEQGRRLL